MQTSGAGVPREIPLSKAIIIVLVSFLLVSAIGTGVGYLFFWNQYDPVTKEDIVIKDAMNMVEKFPEDYRSYLGVGSAYLRKGDPHSALDWFMKAETLKKDDLSIRFNMGLAYYSLKDYDKALETMKPLAEQRSKDFDVQYYMATVYYAKGDYDKAIQTFKQCLILRPGAADANLFLAKTYYKKGDKKSAQTHLDKAMAMVPYYKEAIEFKEKMDANKPID